MSVETFIWILTAMVGYGIIRYTLEKDDYSL